MSAARQPGPSDGQWGVGAVLYCQRWKLPQIPEFNNTMQMVDIPDRHNHLPTETTITYHSYPGLSQNKSLTWPVQGPSA